MFFKCKVFEQDCVLYYIHVLHSRLSSALFFIRGDTFHSHHGDLHQKVDLSGREMNCIRFIVSTRLDCSSSSYSAALKSIIYGAGSYWEPYSNTTPKFSTMRDRSHLHASYKWRENQFKLTHVSHCLWSLNLFFIKSVWAVWLLPYFNNLFFIFMDSFLFLFPVRRESQLEWNHLMK